MKFELRSISYWPLLKVAFVINLIFGFIMGIFFDMFIGAIFSLAAKFSGIGGMPAFQEGMPSLGILLIIYPFLFGFGGVVINTIVALILAFLYNIFVKAIGGLEIELNQIVLQPVAAAPSPMAQAPAYYVTTSHQAPPPPPPPVQPLPPDITPPPDSPGTGN